MQLVWAIIHSFLWEDFRAAELSSPLRFWLGSRLAPQIATLQQCSLAAWLSKAGWPKTDVGNYAAFRSKRGLRVAVLMRWKEKKKKKPAQMLTDWQGILRYMHLYSARNRKEHCGSLESWYCRTPSVKHRFSVVVSFFFYFFLLFQLYVPMISCFLFCLGLCALRTPNQPKKMCSVDFTRTYFWLCMQTDAV